MTPTEMALAQGLQIALDRSTTSSNHLRSWWLDALTPLEEQPTDWHNTWASVVDAAEDPAIVAHLCDLLWLARHGPSPHLYARRAINAYLTMPPDAWHQSEIHRSLTRALDLAAQTNDRDLRTTAEGRLLDEARGALADGAVERSVGVLADCASRGMSEGQEDAYEELLRRAWLDASNPGLVERTSRLLLPRADDEAGRTAIAARIITAYREAASEVHGLQQLTLLRDALRVAEELGDPSHGDILHEIETLDTTGSFTPIRTEHTFSRALVSDFCTGVVGADSIEQSLTRYAFQLPISPATVETIRENTKIGIRHVVTSQRIGEANSIATSTDTHRTTDTDEAVAAAVERDVLQTVGYHALLISHAFLVPALHQLLDSYHPWSVEGLREALTQQPHVDIVVADALARSLHHFQMRRYDEAAHVALPRVERLLRHIARRGGVPTTKRPTTRVGGIRGLGETLADIRSDASGPVLPAPLLTAADLTLVDADSLNLRNDIAHGIADTVDASKAALIVQLGLSLALLLSWPAPDSGDEA